MRLLSLVTGFPTPPPYSSEALLPVSSLRQLTAKANLRQPMQMINYLLCLAIRRVLVKYHLAKLRKQSLMIFGIRLFRYGIVAEKRTSEYVTTILQGIFTEPRITPKGS